MKAKRRSRCLNCCRILSAGEQAYVCEVCEVECCTACSVTTLEHPVVCDACDECAREAGEKTEDEA